MKHSTTWPTKASTSPLPAPESGSQPLSLLSLLRGKNVDILNTIRDTRDLNDDTAAKLKAVVEGGTITLIHRADRLADILALLAPKAGSFRIRPIQPFEGVPAKRVVVRAVKTGKAPLVLLPALVLHEREGGKHAAAAEAILRGEATLDWG